MGWAAFHVVEVMSSPRIHLKTVGYLAATQSFDQETDVLMLTTNLLKKARLLVVQPWYPLHVFLIGLDIHSCRYRNHLEWNITHCNSGFG